MKEWDAKLKGLTPYKELAAKNESLKAGKSVIQKDSKVQAKSEKVKPEKAKTEKPKAEKAKPSSTVKGKRKINSIE